MSELICIVSVFGAELGFLSHIAYYHYSHGTWGSIGKSTFNSLKSFLIFEAPSSQYHFHETECHEQINILERINWKQYDYNFPRQLQLKESQNRKNKTVREV